MQQSNVTDCTFNVEISCILHLKLAYCATLMSSYLVHQLMSLNVLNFSSHVLLGQSHDHPPPPV